MQQIGVIALLLVTPHEFENVLPQILVMTLMLPTTSAITCFYKHEVNVALLDFALVAKMIKLQTKTLMTTRSNKWQPLNKSTPVHRTYMSDQSL